jgi:hypothetical protein
LHMVTSCAFNTHRMVKISPFSPSD